MYQTFNFWMYYVLDDDNIVLYTDRIDGGGGSSPAFARLKDNGVKTWLLDVQAMCKWHYR